MWYVSVKYGIIFFIEYHIFKVQEQYCRPLRSAGLRFLENDVSNSVFDKFSTEGKIGEHALAPVKFSINAQMHDYTWWRMHLCVQVGLVLRDLFLRSFTLTQLENLYHLLSLCDSFWFNKIWHGQSVAALIFCRRLAENDVIVTPPVRCMDWLY